MPIRKMLTNWAMKSLERWWSGYPMVRILVALTAGILSYNGKHDVLALRIALLSAGLSLPFALLGFSPPAMRRSIASLALLMLFVSLGYLLAMAHDDTRDANWFGHQQHGHRFMLAEIIREPSAGKGSVRCIAEIRATLHKEGWHPASGKIWMQLPLGEFTKGQYILTATLPQPISIQAARENGFYRHLRQKQVMFLLKVPESDLLVIPNPNRKRIALLGQRYLRNMLATYINDETSKNMAGAILYGERSTLPNYLTQAYTQTGVIHVIAISGMHLAIIYSLVSFLLKPLQKNKLKWIYSLLCIGMLWIYTWICGGSPSVQRSAWMFSFLLAGETLARNNNAGNSLAASAVVMLCIDPYLLRDIGFQLSYSAVASLLIYQKTIFRLLNPENIMLQHGWNIISTTLSAQILTTPLVIYHFGQFPAIFLLSNMLAVPLSGLILLLLCAAALAYPLGLGSPFARLAEILIQFMNNRIQALSQLSFASISNITLTIPDLINIYLILLAFTLWIRIKKR